MLAWESLGVSRGSNGASRWGSVGAQMMLAWESLGVRGPMMLAWVSLGVSRGSNDVGVGVAGGQ